MPLTIINPITYTDTQTSLSVPAGTIIASSLHVRPTGFLECDGSNTVSRTTYSNLFNAIVPNKGEVTISVPATPAVVTLNNHGFLTGESIFLTSTGSLPSPLNVNTLYYVINVNPTDTANTFRLAESYANAIAGTAMSTTASGNGTHTLFYCPYGLGNNTSNFKLPDLRSATIRGRGLSTGFTPGNNFTTRLGFLEEDSMQGHVHSLSSFVRYNTGTNNYGEGTNFNSQFNLTANTSNTLADGSNGTPRITTETRMKNQGVNFFIKF